MAILNRFFTALHEMQTRSSDENSVCPSVRLSVCLSHDFRVKSHLVWKKSATKFLCVKTVSSNVVRHSLT